MKWYLMAWKKYGQFTGRSRRKEFWYFVLFNFLISWLIGQLDKLLGLNMIGIGTFYSLAALIPSLAVNVRRMHDIGKSGWVYARFLIGFVVTGAAYAIYMAVTAVRDGWVEAIQEGEFAPEMITGNMLWATVAAAIIILVLAIWYIILAATDSQPGTNKWGPNPKAGEIPGTEEDRIGI